MAQTMTEANMQQAKPPPKRRRILDPSALVPVSVYSNQVNSSLQLKAPAFDKKETTEDAAADDSFWSTISCQTKKRSPSPIELSDSEEEAENVQNRQQPSNTNDVLRSLSPPPPESLVQKTSRKAKQKLNEIDRRLQAVNSLLFSPDLDLRRRRRSPRIRDNNDLTVVCPGDDTADDDIIIMSPNPTPLSSQFMAPEREIPLKIRCRTDLHKIPVLPSTPLSAVVEQLSVKLRVPPTRLLLLRDEAELNTEATVSELGLSIADIIECMVMAEDILEAGDSGDIIKVRLQGKDRALTQEYSLNRDVPLASVFSQYVSQLPAAAQNKVRFHFDGFKLSPNQTPAQLDMEDGDIIEVWA